MTVPFNALHMALGCDVFKVYLPHRDPRNPAYIKTPNPLVDPDWCYCEPVGAHTPVDIISEDGDGEDQPALFTPKVEYAKSPVASSHLLSTNVETDAQTDGARTAQNCGDAESAPACKSRGRRRPATSGPPTSHRRLDCVLFDSDGHIGYSENRGSVQRINSRHMIQQNVNEPHLCSHSTSTSAAKSSTQVEGGITGANGRSCADDVGDVVVAVPVVGNAVGLGAHVDAETSAALVTSTVASVTQATAGSDAPSTSRPLYSTMPVTRDKLMVTAVSEGVGDGVQVVEGLLSQVGSTTSGERVTTHCDLHTMFDRAFKLYESLGLSNTEAYVDMVTNFMGVDGCISKRMCLAVPMRRSEATVELREWSPDHVKVVLTVDGVVVTTDTIVKAAVLRWVKSILWVLFNNGRVVQITLLDYNSIGSNCDCLAPYHKALVTPSQLLAGLASVWHTSFEHRVPRGPGNFVN